MNINISKTITKFIFSIFLIIISTVLLINGLNIKNSINNLEKIEGKLIDYETLTLVSTKYCPQYEYTTKNNETNIYSSKICDNEKNSSETKTLYYNEKTKEIKEPGEEKSIFLLVYLLITITIPMFTTSLTEIFKYKNKKILEEYGDL